ncbi:MAG: ATP-binding cassette domain-containing protein [Pseudomonadota bacterium]
MPLLQLDQISLAFGHVPLLDHADLVIQENERIGLIGRNGTGKSSLLKIIAGSVYADDGKVWRAPELRLGYVPQEPEFDPGHTVFEAVAAGLGQVTEFLLDYHAVAQQLGHADADHDMLLRRLHELQAALEVRDGWRLNDKVEAVIQRLGLPEDAKIGSLSGGMKKRVALARALAAEPQLLLLDEPTNHLDVAGIEWLEQWLNGFSGSVLFITHDRRFLDNVATRIIELDRGRLASFPGNFSDYQRVKEEMLRMEAVEQRKFDKFLAQEEVWIRKGIEARRTRNEGRVRRLEALRRERAARRERIGSVQLAVGEGERSGKLVAELQHVHKAFGKHVVIRDFSCVVQRGDKIGLIGPNGVGKSTLLKLILGELEPDSGTVRRGTKLAVAYFDQFRTQLDEERAVADTISPGSDYVEINGERKHVMSYLGDFLFAPERARSPVKSLSGGERNRLLLARLFARPANVMVLDEPTNDLDIETLELLEELLQEYSGTVLLASHDRAFLDNVVTQVIAFEGDGKLVENAGGYAEWQRVKSSHAAPVLSVAAAPSPCSTEKTVRSARPAKLSYKETRELETLPEKISALEQEQAAIARQLEDATLYRDNPEQVKTLQQRYAMIEDEVLAQMMRWEELEEKSKVAG